MPRFDLEYRWNCSHRLMAKEKQTYFTEQEGNQIVEAIERAELATSGEIKVHVEGECEGDAFERGLALFPELGMTETELKNGVLFYIAFDAHKFSIVADQGINEAVETGFWDEITQAMRTKFQSGNMVEGIVLGIQMAGEALGKHFPYQSDDRDELSNDISVG